MYLIVDTETSGFPNPNVANTSSAQARVIQLAAVLVDKDFNEVERLYELLLPSEYLKIADGAFKAHGISLEKCKELGKERELVISKLHNMALRATHVMAHNFQFDDTMIGIEIDNIKDANLAEAYKFTWENLTPICTMEATTNLCKLPFASKRSFGKKYKWPKLEEAMRVLLNKELLNAHDGLSDCLGCLELFRYLALNKYIQIGQA